LTSSAINVPIARFKLRNACTGAARRPGLATRRENDTRDGDTTTELVRICSHLEAIFLAAGA
jgi:hypothetical protein